MKLLICRAGQLLIMSSEVEKSLAIPFVSVVLIERQAFGAYNALFPLFL